MAEGSRCGGNAPALAEAERVKREGNALFGVGMHQEAAGLYNEALNKIESLALSEAMTMKSNSEFKVTLRSNLAACFLAMDQYEQAVAECETALELDPLHVKSRLRLAKALVSLGRVRDAAVAMAVAIALMRKLDVDTTRFYSELTKQSATSSDFILPVNVSSIVSVANSHDLDMALAEPEASVVILKPGSYSLRTLNLFGPLSLIGIGEVKIVSLSHPLHVIEGHVFASHLKLIALATCSAACVDSDARMTLVDCEVHDLEDAGILAEGDAVIERCSFKNLKKQAVEVRMGGSVKLRKCHIQDCKQGVAAYGGAKRVEIISCEISGNHREGVLANGENLNAATRAQNAPMPTYNPTSIAAHRWAQEAKVQLEVVISSSVVKDNGFFGLSLDNGAHTVVENSVLLNNAPFACFVKGATNALISGCHIECRKGLEGVHVGINYGAKVMVNNNTFIVGDGKTAIVEEMSASFAGARAKKALGNMMGAWSRPVTAQNNKILVGKRSSESARDSSLPFPGVPSLESLAAIKGEMVHHGVTSQEEDRGVRLQTPRNLQALARTCRQMCRGSTKVSDYYAVGNTFGYDLSQGQILNVEGGSKVNVFLGACGDIRNVLKTVSCMRHSGQADSHFRMQVVLNDSNMSILARDIVLLSLISRRTSVADIVALWASHAITEAQRALLNSVLHELISSLPKWLTLPMEAKSQISELFSAWRDCTMPLQELLDLHKQNLTLNTNIFESAVKLAENAVGNKQFNKQIREHIKSGNVCNVVTEEANMTSANPLMLQAPTLQYLLYWSSSIYRAIQIHGAQVTRSIGELHDVLLRTITPQIEAVCEALKGGTLHVAIAPGDVLDALLYGGWRGPSTSLEDDDKFDFMDLSNVADYISLPAIVQAALPRLKIVSHARIHIQSMQWSNLGLADPAAFLRLSIGMELETYQELLGVSMRAEVGGPTTSQPVLRTQWAWDLRRSSTTSWLTGATVLLDIMSAAKLHCATDRVSNVVPQPESQSQFKQFIISGKMAGLDCSSPVTLLHLLYLTCPASLVMPLVQVLVNRNGTHRKRRWELQGHALMQCADSSVRSQQSFCRVEFEAKAQYYELLACTYMPLCVVVSRVRLVPGEEVPSTSVVVQLIEAFTYSPESDRVEFLLQRALVDDPKCKSNNYFVSLCVIADSTRLEAVGSSVELRKLVRDSLVSPLPIWTPPPATRPWLSQDATLVQMLSERIPAEEVTTQTASCWSTYAVHETSTLVVVELLLPRPFPSADKATLVVSSSGDRTMKVIVKAVPVKKTKTQTKALSSTKPSGSARNSRAAEVPEPDDFAFPEHYEISLPAAVASKGHIVKLSRRLGLMVVRLSKLLST